jgi:hypothetical protein
MLESLVQQTQQLLLEKHQLQAAAASLASQNAQLEERLEWLLQGDEVRGGY